MINDPQDINIPTINSKLDEYIGCLTSEYIPLVFIDLGIYDS